MEPTATFLENLFRACEDHENGVVVISQCSEDGAIVAKATRHLFLNDESPFAVWFGHDFPADPNLWWWDSLESYREGVSEGDSDYSSAFEAVEMSVSEVLKYKNQEQVNIENLGFNSLLSF